MKALRARYGAVLGRARDSISVAEVKVDRVTSRSCYQNGQKGASVIRIPIPTIEHVGLEHTKCHITVTTAIIIHIFTVSSTHKVPRRPRHVHLQAPNLPLSSRTIHTMQSHNSPPATSSPLLIFVLGAPCSGKSTLCTALSTKYSISHFSLGDELRKLISPHPTGPAALIKPTLSAEEVATFKGNVTENTLAPLHLTPKYVKERLFGVGATPGDIRVLVDGFPRDVARWHVFKDAVKESWVPSENGVLVVLHVDRETARVRSEKRSRVGDSFEKRFEEHEKNVGEVVDAMRADGMTVLEVDANGRIEMDNLMGRLEVVGR